MVIDGLKRNDTLILVIISASTEWKTVVRRFPDAVRNPSIYGEWFKTDLDVAGRLETVLFFHGGWGKVSAAASTQYAIDRWSPHLLINLGTCGGFEGEVERETILLAERTLIYDIIEQMSDPEEAIAHYTTDLDLSWLTEPFPMAVRESLMVSADRDLIPDDIHRLKSKFGAIAGDWESGAIAYVAARNDTRCLILRGVSDLVGEHGGEAYEDIGIFEDYASAIMERLIDSLPSWIANSRGN